MMFHMFRAERLGVKGASLVLVRDRLICTRSKVTRRAIRPGTTSGGMRKLIQLADTNRMVGMNVSLT